MRRSSVHGDKCGETTARGKAYLTRSRSEERERKKTVFKENDGTVLHTVDLAA